MKYFLFGFIPVIIFTLSTNYIVDPYGILNDGAIIKIERPLKFKRELDYKLSLTDVKKYEGVIIGTSRVRYGINPQNILNRSKDYINLGTGGQNYYITRLMYEKSKVNANEIILGIDFFPANAYYKDNANQQPENYLNILFSISTFADSIVTLYKKDSSSNFDDFGFHENFQSHNYRVESDKSDKNYLVSVYLNRPECNFKFQNENFYPLAEIYKILEDAYNLDKKIIIFIPPVHARHQYLIYRSNLQGYYNEWVRNIVKMNTHFANKYNKAEYNIWDFSYINQYTSDPIPGYADDFKMKYYLETAHFNSLIGDKILCKIRDYCSWENFGEKLNNIDLDYYLIARQKKLIDWAKNNIYESNYINNMVNIYINKGCIYSDGKD